MYLIHLYTGSDGQSHFDDIELALDGPHGSVEWLTGLQGVAFRDVPSGFSAGYHNTPRRQLVLQLTGRGELVCGDGTSRIVGPGDLLLADDRTGQGHLSREVEGPRRQMYLYLDPALDLETLRAR
jgi:hypothetical protein